MNEKTLQRLEYPQIKERVKEQAVTYLGRELVEQMQPMVTLKAVMSALQETAEAADLIKHGANVPLPSLEGMETVFGLLGKGYVFSEADFGAVATFLNSCRHLKKYMAGKSGAAPRVASYAEALYALTDLKSEIERCIRHGRVTDEASGELAKVRKKIAVAEERVKKRMDALLSKHRSILQENIVSLRGGRYVIPVKKEHRRLVQGAVLDESASGQTVYIEPAEIGSLQYELNALRSEEAREETKVLAMLTGMLEGYERELLVNADGVGRYDFLFAKAKYARAIGGVAAEVNDGGLIDVKDAVHPLLGRAMVPLSFEIGRRFRTLIITGPNTGGKTVALKTVGLLTLMVQSGLLVPAAPDSTFAIFTNIAADIGDGQSLEQSLSTFSAHVKNIVEILKSANRSTLVLIDEMASGTDPGEGVGLSIAVLEELYRRGATVVATTHFNEIKRFAAAAPGFENARMEFDTETLEPLYRLRIGEAGRSYAFVIASKLGMPEKVLARSRQLTSVARGEGPLDFGGAAELPAFKPAISDSVQEGESDGGVAIDGNRFEIGDSVYIPSMGRSGIVYAVEDAMGNVGVQIQKEKLSINQKRLKPFISKEQLYPKDYDFDIVFESKENRKNKKLMSKRHAEGVMIVRKAEEK
ncbi:endonuclease MutS2 [Paenibacillus thermotolerans]|uniref:endonuclease MutS2 n=1 Tax=Paenibacillus thermotolerans TaxID=3027807 RepID=UPI0023689251|nr:MULTISPECIES: DNA mismatch repair protein MutS [unclassified Paenibacillus]